MPIIVDKNQERTQILDAFEQCVLTNPISKISLRRIAEKGNISHSKILWYFKNKEELLVEYAKRITHIYTESLYTVFEQAKAHKDVPKLAVENMIRSVYQNNKDNVHGRIFIQLYAIGINDPGIKQVIEAAYGEWKAAFKDILRELYCREMDEEAQALLVVMEGLILYNVNDNFDISCGIRILDTLANIK